MTLQRWLTWLPLAWLLVFAVAPYLVLLGVSLAQIDDLGVPPYTPLWRAATAHAPGQWQGSLDNFRLLAGDVLYVEAYLTSLRIAALGTLLCLAIGYPLAYGVARANERARLPLLMLIVLPFWTSFLLRVYAWIGLLEEQGILNSLLQAIGLIGAPLQLLRTEFAVVLGIAYAYLPFMVLPIYAVLARLPAQWLDAAADLGATPWRRFRDVTLPLSLPGVIAGALLVFVPAVGEFVIPDMLGGSSTTMVGKVLWNEFFGNGDWPVASAIAVVMMLVLVLPLMLFDRYSRRFTDDNATDSGTTGRRPGMAAPR